MMILGAIVGLACATMPMLPAQATFPGRNGRIVYTNGSGGISTIKPNATGADRITHLGSNNEAPQVSADGQWVVFDNYVKGDLYVVRMDGTGQRRVTKDGNADYEWSPSWSPNGKRIVFATNGVGSQITVINADGTHEHALGTAMGEWPRYSPDGKKIVYEGDDGNIHVMDANGANDAPLLPGAYPDWSPNGKKIAFLKTSQIWVMNADSSNAQAVSAADAAWGPSWSPDGKKIVYPAGGFTIMVINADGTNPVPVTSYTECCVAWAPAS